MLETLAPPLIVQATAAGLTDGRFTAVAIQVDISGFTNLTTTIMAQDLDGGGEVVADLMRDLFNPLIGLVNRFGGFVGMFAGDAFTAFFPFGDEGVTQVDAVHQALTAVWQMQQTTNAFTHISSFGHFQFSVKIGVGLGRVEWRVFSLRSSDSDPNEMMRTVYSFAGDGLRGCIDALLLADSNDVILDMAVMRSLPHGLISVTAIGANTPDFVRMTMLLDFAVAVGVEIANQTQVAGLPATQHFVPTALQDKTTSGEFRQVVSVFVGVEDRIDTLSQLIPLVELIYELQATYGGYLNAVRFGDKGMVLVMFWGAPVSLERDVTRAANFAHILRQRSPFILRMGLSYRWLYAGLIGADTRQDYTCYGGGTSFSARLMISAERGQILLDSTVATRIESLFDLTELGKRPMKGFADLQQVYRLEQPKDGVATFDYEQPFVGREAEMERLWRFMAQLFTRRFVGMYTLRGEAGSGKSRLIHEMRQQLEQLYSGRLTWCYAQADELVRTDLNPFRYLLQTYFKQSPEANDEQNKARFTAGFELLLSTCGAGVLSDELDRTRSFIAALLGLYWPDSTYGRLTPELRKHNLHQGIIAFFQVLCRLSPVVLQIEDAHWIDDTSQKLLERLLAELEADSADGESHGLVVLVTTREITGGGRVTLTGVQLMSDIVGTFGQADLALFVSNMLGQSISDDFISFLLERTEGNPFFVEQTILYLQEMGHLNRDGDVVRLTGDSLTISSDIRAVLLARIDRLLPGVQETVQTAAVLGREFSLNVLRRMLLTQKEQIDNHVDIAYQSAIWVQLLELRYLFKHALLRDVAYQMQLQSRRQQLHAVAYDSILTLYQADLTPYYGELAYHAEQAERIEAAIEYLTKAGDAAAETFQNESAIAYYGRCLTLLEQNRSESHDELQFQLLMSLANVYRVVSVYDITYEIAIKALYLARQKREMDKIMQVFVLLGRVSRRTGNYLVGISYLRHALAYHQTRKEHVQSAEILDLISLIDWNQENFSLAVYHAHQALDLIDVNQRTAVHASISLGLAMSFLDLDDYQSAEPLLIQAHQMYKELDNTLGYATTVEVLAGLNLYKGSYDRAIVFYEEAIALAQQVGWQQLLMRLLSNSGQLFTQMGRYEEADKKLGQSLVMAEAMGGTYAQAWILAYLADLYLHLGKYDDAHVANSRSFELAQQVSSGVFMFRARLLDVQLAIVQNRKDEALVLLDQIREYPMTKSQEGDVEYFSWVATGDVQAGVKALSLYQEIIVRGPKASWVTRVIELSHAFNGDSAAPSI